MKTVQRLDARRLISAAQALVTNDHLPSPSRHAAVREMWPDHRWDLGVVHWAGFTSHFDARTGESAWPLPDALDADGLAAYAAERAALSDAPRDGDVFLMWSPSLTIFSRVGIVLAQHLALEMPAGARAYDCVTVEGNTRAEIGRSGPAVLVHTRRLVPSRGDRFIHWPALPCARVANPHVSARAARMFRRAA